MSLDKDLIRSLTGEYDLVAKATAGDTPKPSPVAASVAEGDPVNKALVISVAGTEVSSAGNARPSVEAEQNFFLGAGALIPRYDPWALARVWENSSALRPCVDAYAANVDGYGFRLEPVIDLDKGDASKLVRSALLQQRIYEGSADPVTDDHVQATIETMRLEMEREKFTLERFFAYCCPTTSFLEMRMNTRVELEATGNAAWEVVRDGRRKIQFFERIDVVTMRMRPIQIEHILVDTRQKTSPINYSTVPVPRRFRTFVQLVNGLIAVYFKEFGDPRTMSAKTGNFYDGGVEELKEKEGELAVEATEILWWSIFAPIGPYGVPRWVGATMNVLGLRAAEEFNFSYFDKNCIPAMAVLVSGGTLKEGAVDTIRAHFKEALQGRENQWAVLVIEAESAPGSAMSAGARVKIELRPLMGDRPQDALFQQYEENGVKKVGAQFRVPELLRGVSQEVNRAQAYAVLDFFETQVAQVLRGSFDHVMNRRVFADMGIRFWQFATNSAPATDPAQLVEFVSSLATAGTLSVNETRELAGEALNKDFKKRPEAWGDVPFQLTLQKVLDPATGEAPQPAAVPGPGGPPVPPPPGSPPGAHIDHAHALVAHLRGEPPPPVRPPPGAPPPPGGAPQGQPSPPPQDPTAKRLVVPLAKLLEWVTPDAVE